MTPIPDNLPAGTTHFCPAFGRYPERALRLGPCDKWAYWTGFSWFDLLHAPPPSVRREAIDLRPTAQRVYATWNGDGLPPVGAVCGLRSRGGGWGEAEIRYHGRGLCVWLWVRHDGNTDQIEYAESPDRLEFRPIRTAEQIAAEERERVANEMVRHFAFPASQQDTPWKGLFLQMYDCGVLKP